jgi:hypothetical protein
MKKIILAVCIALLMSCTSPREERRMVCTSFTTPWAWSAWVNDGGLVVWRVRKHEDREYYKLLPGDACRRETR